MYYQEYFYIDKMLRAALYGTTEELMQALRLVKLSKDRKSRTLDSDNYRITAIHQVRRILI